MARLTEFNAILGNVFEAVAQEGDAITFKGTTNFRLYHALECSEDVKIEDICGDLSDLEGSPIIRAEMRNNEGETPHNDMWQSSSTWSFYELSTIKGSVTIRFYGVSNGYYSETAELYEID